MKSNLTTIIVFFSITAIGLAGFSCSKEKAREKPPGHEQMVEQYQRNLEDLKKVVVAKVNGADITKYDVFTRARKLTSSYSKLGQQITPDIEKKAEKEALDELIFRELAIQEAIRRQMKVPQQDIDAMLRAYKAKVGSEKDYKAHLRNENMTEASIIKLIERELLFRMIAAEEIQRKITVDEKLLRETYQKEKKKGTVGQMSFEEARGRIEKDLRASLADKRKKQWETELKKNAKIELPAGTEIKEQGGK